MPSSLPESSSTDRVARLCTSIGLVVAAASMAILPAMLAERTVAMQGVTFHPWWPWVVASSLIGLISLAAHDPPALVSTRPQRPHWTRIIGSVFAIALALCPLPPAISVGLVLAAVSSLFKSFARTPRAESLSCWLERGAVAWLIAALGGAVFAHVEPRVAWGTILSHPLSLAVQALGTDATFDRGFLYIRDAGYTHRILASPDKFGGAFPILFVLTGAYLARCRGFRWRSVFAFGALTMGYALLSGAWLVARSVHGPAAAHGWWSEADILLTFTPLLLAMSVGLAWVTSPTPGHPPISGQAVDPRGRTRSWSGGLIGGGAGLLVMSWLWVGPGAIKPGSIVFDEHYSDWEPSYEPLDELRYGVRTVYNYWNLADALGHYVDVTRNTQTITDETLQGVSVLILKTPTRAYEPEALDCIDRYVRKGGGLWLIGDHTNVFGMTGHLNSIGARFGLRFASDAVVDADSNRELMQTHPWDHPIVRRMPLFLWMTGHSTQAPWGARDVVSRSNLLCDAPDFSQNTGFGDFLPALDEPIGSVTQVVAFEHGRGRIAHWSDSTVFSNFAVFYPGKFEVALGFIDWLRRDRTARWGRAALAISGLLLVMTSLLLAWPHPKSAMIPLAVWMGLGAGYGVTMLMREAWYPPMQPREALHSSLYVEFARHPIQQPVLTIYQDPMAFTYSTAFLAMQRTGWHPQCVSSLPQASPPSLILLASGGGRDITQANLDQLIAAAHEGSTVAWLDLGAAPPWIQSRLLDLLGIRWSRYEFKQNSELQEAATAVAGVHAGDILPKGPVLYAPDGSDCGAQRVGITFELSPSAKPVLTIGRSATHPPAIEISVGKGRFIITGTIDAFNDESLGNPSDVPGPLQRRLLQCLFDMFRDP